MVFVATGNMMYLSTSTSKLFYPVRQLAGRSHVMALAMGGSRSPAIKMMF